MLCLEPRGIRVPPVVRNYIALRIVEKPKSRGKEAGRNREMKKKMSPKEVIRQVVKAFNEKDIDRVAAFFREDAVCHQVSEQPIYGREAIREMVAEAVGRLKMEWIVENIFEDGEWAILEGKDLHGFKGCTVFRVVDSRILLQRGYWFNSAISGHYEWSFQKKSETGARCRSRKG